MNASPPNPSHDAGTLRARSILVGVTGGIAAYKTAALVSRLAQAGATVTVAMTDAATRFVAPLTFQALSGRPVYTDQWQHIEASDPQHIALARSAHLAIVAPCTMDAIARLAAGLTSDMVTLMLSAIDRAATPVLLAPSMNEVMWAQPATQRNRAQLEADGFRFIGPTSGWQACRAVGPGRMAEPDDLFTAIVETLGARADAHRRIGGGG